MKLQSEIRATPHIRRTLLAAAVVVTFAGPAAAQFVARTYPGFYRGPVGVGYGYGGYGYGGYAATPYSVNANAAAEVLSAKGEYLKDSTEAAGNYEQARALYIQNQMAAFEAYQQKRQIGEQLQDQRRAEDRERAQRAAEVNRNKQPKVLGRGQVDDSSGELAWPASLQEPVFDDDRQRINDLFAIRAQSGASQQVNEKIVAAADQALAELRTMVRNISPPQYIDAQNFLMRIRNEGRYR